MNRTRRDFATVLVRFAGLHFAYVAFKQVASMAFFIWFVFETLVSFGEGISLSEKITLSTILPGAVSFVVSTSLSYYLIRKGNWVIEFLSKDSINRPDQVEP
jgi:hypothetical protein